MLKLVRIDEYQDRLPERLSANGLLQALNTLYSREELRAALEKEE